MATFLLVHGGWHGGWCWGRVAPLLRAADHDVFTPTLTGLGDRTHLLNPAVGLTTHVEDILGVLHYDDLRDVILVGHSYGGMVITGVAAHATDRIAHLVYLDAFVPGDGQCMFDLLPSDRATAFREQAAATGDGWRIPPPPVERYGVTDEADIAWARPRVGAQPILTFEQPIRCLPVPVPPRTYIFCTGFAGSAFATFAMRAKEDTTWRYRELSAGHDAMVTTPREVADLLVEIASPAVPTGK